MSIREYLPFQQAPPSKKVATAVTQQGTKALAKLMKSAAIPLGPGSFTIGSRANFEDSPFNFDEIIQMIDTDSYVRQAFAKYKELFFKEGWDLVGQNPEAVSYVRQRIALMELAMRQPFSQFLMEAADQLVKFHNSFIAKVRADIDPLFPLPIKGLKDKQPIIGYEIIAAETVRIRRNANNQPTRYRQETSGAAAGLMKEKQPEWNAEEVIHLHIDKRPQHLFGTPFVMSAIDDVRSLRQIEEDILNLVHQELFPFYTVTVGTELEPADDDEIIAAAQALQDMRVEGAMVHSERRKIEVLGAAGEALDASEYVQHFKERVCVGLGLAPHHLGMMMNGGNRSVTDRLDVALYDKIKLYQRYVAAAIQMFIIDELLLEGGFNPYVLSTRVEDSDRVEFRFREIDVDTKIKKDNHTVMLFTSNLLETGEARVQLNMDPEMDEAETSVALAARMMPDQPQTSGPDKTPSLVDTTPGAAKKDGQAPSTGGRPNPKNQRKGVGNANRPANQHGRSTSPKVRRDDDNDVFTELNELLELIGEEDGEH